MCTKEKLELISQTNPRNLHCRNIAGPRQIKQKVDKLSDSPTRQQPNAFYSASSAETGWARVAADR